MSLTREQELYIITMEECGELIQALSKMLRGGDEWKEQNLKNLQDEAGDVLCMIDLLIKNDTVSERKLNKRKLEKLQKLKQYSKLLDNNED